MTFECGFGKAKLPLPIPPQIAPTLTRLQFRSHCDNILCKSLPNSAMAAMITMTHLTTANNLFTLHYATSHRRAEAE